MKSPYSGITKNDITVIHDKGVAKEAFSGKETSKLFWVNIVIYIIAIAWLLRQLFINDYYKYSYINPYEKVLIKKMPWYISTNQWKELRKDAIDNIFGREYILMIEETLMYKILNTDKNQNLTDDEWEIIKNKSEKKLALSIEKNIYENFDHYISEQIYRLKKPKHISQIVWDDIKHLISRSFCNEKIFKLTKYTRSASIEVVLKQEKPEFVLQEHWDETKKIFQTLYLFIILEETATLYKLNEINNKFNFEFIADNFKKEILKIIEILEKSSQLEEYYEVLLDTLRNTLFFKELPKDKPSIINQNDWESIININEIIVKTKAQSSLELQSAEKIKTEYEPLKQIITSQLEIIDRILNDPDYVLKVEDYNNPFKEGNWTNLKKIADIFKSINK